MEWLLSQPTQSRQRSQGSQAVSAARAKPLKHSGGSKLQLHYLNLLLFSLALSLSVSPPTLFLAFAFVASFAL